MAITDRDKRTLRIGGIALGVLPAAFLLPTPPGGGGSEEEAPPFPPRPTTSVSAGSTGGASGSESPSLAPSPVLVLPVRDPFAIPAGFPVSSSGATTTGG